MSQKFVFDELDEATRDYLTAVRDAEGSGAPGVFAPTSSALAGCGCIAGPIIIIATLLFTLTSWINVIYDDPTRVALLQTAGLVVGGWLLVAAARSAAAKKSRKFAGYWVYADPLYLYEANREQIKITRIDDVVEANFTHNYNNGSYQNSKIRILLGDNSVAQVTLNNEARAEQMVVFLNYLAWARGEGGERAALPPATLGGLAKYVSKNDAEPKDADGNINLNLVELDITEIPEEPAREGRAMPALLPYVVIFVAGIGVFFVMSRIINPPLRDDAIFDAVTKVTQPPSVEPRFLRAYLIDDRNTRHRDEVQKQLASFYTPVINHVNQHATSAELKGGMVKILESLSTADQPVVSIRVTELMDGKPSGKAGAGERQKKLRDGVVGGSSPAGVGGGILDEFAKVSGPIQPPPGILFAEQPPPIGHQLIAFAEAPEPEPGEKPKPAHFEIVYNLKPGTDPNVYQVEVTIMIRSDVVKTDENGNPLKPDGNDGFLMPVQYRIEQLDGPGMDAIRDQIVKEMVGKM